MVVHLVYLSFDQHRLPGTSLDGDHLRGSSPDKSVDHGSDTGASRTTEVSRVKVKRPVRGDTGKERGITDRHVTNGEELYRSRLGYRSQERWDKESLWTHKRGHLCVHPVGVRVPCTDSSHGDLTVPPSQTGSDLTGWTSKGVS